MVSQGDASREVTVIGAGIVGVCCALYLQREGFAVTVVDREAPGEGCSKGNAGIFGAASCVPLALPGAARRLPRTLLSSCSSLSVRLHHLPKVAPWLLRFLVSSRRRRAEEIARALRSLQRSLFDAYAPLLEDAGAAAMVQRSGKLHVYESRQAFERDGLERDIQRRNGVEVRELTGEQARELEPALAPGVMNAAYFPQVAHCIDPFRLVQTLVGHFLRTGGRLVRATVKAFELGSKGPCRLVTESGVMDVETLVIAAGAWSRPLAALLHGPEQIADLPVPVVESPGAVRIGHPERGHLVEYLAPNSVFNSLPRQRSCPHLGPDDRFVTIDRVLHHASLGAA